MQHYTHPQLAGLDCVPHSGSHHFFSETGQVEEYLVAKGKDWLLQVVLSMGDLKVCPFSRLLLWGDHNTYTCLLGLLQE